MKTESSQYMLLSLSTAAVLCLSGCSKQPAEVQDHTRHDDSLHSHSGSHGTPSPTAEPGQEHCAAHETPVSLCFICDPSLREKGRLWCTEHGRYEDRCWICHPELQDANRPFCNVHGLYEDECFYCDPSLAQASDNHSSADVHGQELFCAEHGVPEAACGICRPDALAQLNTGQALKVRLPSTRSAQSAGVQTGRPSVGGIMDGIESYAELMFDQNKLAKIVAPVSGIIEQVPVDLGSRVGEGEIVARLWSAQIAEAVAEAVLTHQTLDRERRLREQRVTSEQELQKAEAAHRAACQQLRTYGFTEQQIDVLSHNPEDIVLLDVKAPFAGEIIERLAVRGELAEAGRHLFTVGDRSVMWALLNIPEAHLGRLAIGQTVDLQFDSIPEKTFSGKLTWISAEVDERTRMIRARAEVPNPEGILRARMFAKARILTRSPEGALLLPSSAIQRVEGKSFIFVKIDDDLFEARRVALGARLDGRVEVLDGLGGEEVVAMKHVFPLKSQLLISRLGAGCAHE